jgi:hypothetical protein
MMLKPVLYLFLITIIVISFTGCSGSESPVHPETVYTSLPVGISDMGSDGIPAGGSGALGIFNLHVDAANLNAQLTPLRQTELTDVLEVVDITNFLRLAPCVDCAKIKSVALDSDGNLVVSIGIKHPFNPGDPLKPISGRNRGDLHVFNVEGIVVSNSSGTGFPGINAGISGVNLINADGYTGYLDNSLDEIFPTDATVHPYVLHFDDYSSGNFDASNPMGFESVTAPPPSGNLVMAMGCDYDYKDYVFGMSDRCDLIYAIGCTYAVSAATKIARFTPEYRIPQHNKKAASEVSFNITSNNLRGGDMSSSAQIEVHVVDISHGVPVGTALNEMLADSSVNDILIDVPGITSTPVILDGSSPVSGSGHDPSDPLIYEGIITNTLGAPEGNYTGLIKVTDNYAPGQNQSPLLNGMDGIKRADPLINPLTGMFMIDEFATYQVFNISIVSGEELTVTDIEPDNAIVNSFVDDAVITGTGFSNVTSVRLEMLPEVIEADTFIVDSVTQITADFDLSGFPPGLYDVTVETDGVNTASLDDGFEIQFECKTGIHDTLQYEGTYQLNWNQAPTPSWHRSYDIASLPDGRILMQGFSSGLPCLMAFDVTQDGLVNGEVLISGQWGTNIPNWTMSCDVCEVTGNIALIIASNSGKLMIFNSSGGHIDSIGSAHDVYTAVDTDWDGGIWTVEYVLNSDPTPMGIQAFIEHIEWDGSHYTRNPAHSLEITSDLELNPHKVCEIGIVHSAKRLILIEHSSFPWKGNMYNYDLTNGAPELMPALTQMNFLSSALSESQIGHWRMAFDIEIDHSDPISEECRIMLARRSGSGWTDGSYLAKYDINMNKLAEYHIEGTATQDHLLETFALCKNPDDPDGIFLTIHEGWLSEPDMDAFEVYAMPTDW